MEQLVSFLRSGPFFFRTPILQIIHFENRLVKNPPRIAIFFFTGLFWQETKIPVAQQLTLGVINISIQPNVTGLYVVVHVSMQKIQVQQLHM